MAVSKRRDNRERSVAPMHWGRAQNPPKTLPPLEAVGNDRSRPFSSIPCGKKAATLRSARASGPILGKRRRAKVRSYQGGSRYVPSVPQSLPPSDQAVRIPLIFICDSGKQGNQKRIGVKPFNDAVDDAGPVVAVVGAVEGIERGVCGWRRRVEALVVWWCCGDMGCSANTDIVAGSVHPPHPSRPPGRPFPADMGQLLHRQGLPTSPSGIRTM